MTKAWSGPGKLLIEGVMNQSNEAINILNMNSNTTLRTFFIHYCSVVFLDGNQILEWISLICSTFVSLEA